MDSRQAGSKGGKETVSRHGQSHMAAIGAKGFAATVNRHYQGDRAAYLKHLRERAHEKGVGGFVDRYLQDQIDSGKQIASVELTVLSDPDDSLPF